VGSETQKRNSVEQRPDPPHRSGTMQPARSKRTVTILIESIALETRPPPDEVKCGATASWAGPAGLSGAETSVMLPKNHHLAPQ